MRLLAIILIAISLNSCTKGSPVKATAITLMIDRTDTIIPSPEPGIVQELINIEASPNNGIIFRFQNIGNTDYNSTYKAVLGDHSVLDNQLIRQAEVGKFFRKIDTLIFRENSHEYHFNTSSIITPLLQQLTTLKNETASEKVAVIWTDLGEISDVYNILTHKNRKMVLNEPTKVVEHFKRQLDIPDLNGVTLYIAHLPKTREQNRMFRGMCKVYEELFKDSGLELHIGLDQQLKL